MEKIIIGKREAARFLGVTRQAFYNRGEMPPADFESIEESRPGFLPPLKSGIKGFRAGGRRGRKISKICLSSQFKQIYTLPYGIL